MWQNIKQTRNILFLELKLSKLVDKNQGRIPNDQYKPWSNDSNQMYVGFNANDYLIFHILKSCLYANEKFSNGLNSEA